MFFVSTLSFECPVVRLTVGNYLWPGSGIANHEIGMGRRQCACICANHDPVLKSSSPSRVRFDLRGSLFWDPSCTGMKPRPVNEMSYLLLLCSSVFPNTRMTD